MRTIEIKIKFDATKDEQIALLKDIYKTLLTDDNGLSSGEVRALLYNVLDFTN